MEHVTALAPSSAGERARSDVRHGVREVIGPAAWGRLPEAVRERFGDVSASAVYAGAYEVVQASALGRAFAWLGTLFGMPVAPRVGTHVESRVFVHPHGRGVAWDREYVWADGTRSIVRSTKVVTDDCLLVEVLPARLCMPLDTFEKDGVLHFVSRGYYFDLGLGLKLWLPALLSPGITHVEHIDLGHGWFRFTMTVTHRFFGTVFFQTGRFCAGEDLS